MIGTAIRNQPFGMIACAGRSPVWSGPINASGRRGQRGGDRASFAVLTVEAQKLLTAFMVFSVLFASAVCGPAAHQWLDRASSASVQLVAEVAQIPEVVPQIAKVPGEQGSQMMGGLQAFCTGHCAAHAFNLPPLFIDSVVPFVIRAAWPFVEDQTSHASRPGRLERPPRV